MLDVNCSINHRQCSLKSLNICQQLCLFLLLCKILCLWRLQNQCPKWVIMNLRKNIGSSKFRGSTASKKEHFNHFHIGSLVFVCGMGRPSRPPLISQPLDFFEWCASILNFENHSNLCGKNASEALFGLIFVKYRKTT